MRRYFETVTLGAFTLGDSEKNKRFMVCINEMRLSWLVLHFLLITVALNFPVMFAVAALPPDELFLRLLGSGFMQEAEMGMDEFNTLMLENGFARYIRLPLVAMECGAVLILQLVFYALASFFLGLSRLHTDTLTFRSRLALLLFSSTLPVCAAALFGLYLPTVHIIVFYFAVILMGFYRSSVCQNQNG